MGKWELLIHSEQLDLVKKKFVRNYFVPPSLRHLQKSETSVEAQFSGIPSTDESN